MVKLYGCDWSLILFCVVTYLLTQYTWLKVMNIYLLYTQKIEVQFGFRKVLLFLYICVLMLSYLRDFTLW